MIERHRNSIENLLLALRNFSAFVISPMVENHANWIESLLLARIKENNITLDLAHG